MTTTDFYPDAHVETTTVDGMVRRILSPAGESFATIRTSAGNEAYPSLASTSIVELVCHGSTADTYTRLTRSIYLFNTGPTIPANAVIDSATFALRGTGYAGNNFLTAAQTALALVNATPAGNTDLVAADYGQVKTTRYATDFALASWNVSGYNTFTLNAAGIAAIAKGSGVTKFGCALAVDVDGGTISTWKANGDAYYNCYYADQGSNKPTLSVTWHTPAGGTYGFVFG